MRVEGKWIPKAIADNWKKSFADLKKKLEQNVTGQVSDTDQLKEANEKASEGLDKLLAAKTQEEFNAALSELMATMSGGGGGPGPGVGPDPSGGPSPPLPLPLQEPKPDAPKPK